MDLLVVHSAACVCHEYEIEIDLHKTIFTCEYTYLTLNCIVTHIPSVAYPQKLPCNISIFSVLKPVACSLPHTGYPGYPQQQV